MLVASIAHLLLTQVGEDIRARLLENYRLPTVRHSVAAARLGLDPMTPRDACARTIAADEVRDGCSFTSTERIPPLDEIGQIFAVEGYMRSYWNDPRLRYNNNCSDAGVVRLLSPAQWPLCFLALSSCQRRSFCDVHHVGPHSQLERAGLL